MVMLCLLVLLFTVVGICRGFHEAGTLKRLCLNVPMGWWVMALTTRKRMRFLFPVPDPSETGPGVPGNKEYCSASKRNIPGLPADKKWG